MDSDTSRRTPPCVLIEPSSSTIEARTALPTAPLFLTLGLGLVTKPTFPCTAFPERRDGAFVGRGSARRGDDGACAATVWCVVRVNSCRLVGVLRVCNLVGGCVAGGRRLGGACVGGASVIGGNIRFVSGDSPIQPRTGQRRAALPPWRAFHSFRRAS